MACTTSIEVSVSYSVSQRNIFYCISLKMAIRIVQFNWIYCSLDITLDSNCGFHVTLYDDGVPVHWTVSVYSCTFSCIWKWHPQNQPITSTEYWYKNTLQIAHSSNFDDKISFGDFSIYGIRSTNYEWTNFPSILYVRNIYRAFIE